MLEQDTNRWVLGSCSSALGAVGPNQSTWHHLLFGGAQWHFLRSGLILVSANCSNVDAPRVMLKIHLFTMPGEKSVSRRQQTLSKQPSHGNHRRSHGTFICSEFVKFLRRNFANDSRCKLACRSVVSAPRQLGQMPFPFRTNIALLVGVVQGRPVSSVIACNVHLRSVTGTVCSTRT